jgi:hypothetical protein
MAVMGILAWIHNRGGRDEGDMYGGVDRCDSADLEGLYEEKRRLPLSSKIEVFVARPSGDVVADVEAVWADAMQRWTSPGYGAEIELHAGNGLVRLLLEPGFDELEELVHMLTSTCQLVEVRDRATESAA